jgi:hypothetical protein
MANRGGAGGLRTGRRVLAPVGTVFSYQLNQARNSSGLTSAPRSLTFTNAT